MEALKLHRIREEKIGGVIYDKSPAPHFKHSQVCHNVGFKIYEGLKNSMCSVYIENLDYMYDAESDNYLEPDIIICEGIFAFAQVDIGARHSKLPIKTIVCE